MLCPLIRAIEKPFRVILGGFSIARFYCGLIFSEFLAARAAFLATAILLIHGGPSPTLGLVFRQALLFVAFFDVFGLTFLLVSVGRFISLWHDKKG